MKQKNSYHMNIGGASIMLILAVFSLTVFAILSLRASYHEVQMSEKTRDSIEDYYTADAKAEEVLMDISELVATNTKGSEISQRLQELEQVDCVTFDETTHILTYNILMEYNKSLEITLKLPMKPEENVQVHSWRMISTIQDEYEDSDMEDIWDGILGE